MSGTSGKSGGSAKRPRGAAKAVERKAPARAASSRRPSKREPAKRVAVSGLRTLGDVEPSTRRATRTRGGSQQMASKAKALLAEEFERVLAMKEKLRAEARIGGKEKGREALGQTEKMRGLVSSLEGMNRFALKMGLITPAESRELYAAAMKRGLHEGTR